VTLRRELQSANIQIILAILAIKDYWQFHRNCHSPIFVNSENFEKKVELSVGGSPESMAAANGQLHVAENQTNSVSMLNPQSRLVQKRVSVGIAPRRLLSAPQKIYRVVVHIPLGAEPLGLALIQ
jgi:hypothetical protein